MTSPRYGFYGAAIELRHPATPVAQTASVFVRHGGDAYEQPSGERCARIGRQRQRLLDDLCSVPFSRLLERGLVVVRRPWRGPIGATHEREISTSGHGQNRRKRRKGGGERRRGSSVPPLPPALCGRMGGEIKVIGEHVDSRILVAARDFAALHRAALCAARIAVGAAVSSSERGIWGVRATRPAMPPSSPHGRVGAGRSRPRHMSRSSGGTASAGARNPLNLEFSWTAA
jgi:hypothetical protein